VGQFDLARMQQQKAVKDLGFGSWLGGLLLKLLLVHLSLLLDLVHLLLLECPGRSTLPYLDHAIEVCYFDSHLCSGDHLGSGGASEARRFLFAGHGSLVVSRVVEVGGS
jgi:hypothetical protein